MECHQELIYYKSLNIERQVSLTLKRHFHQNVRKYFLQAAGLWQKSKKEIPPSLFNAARLL